MLNVNKTMVLAAIACVFGAVTSEAGYARVTAKTAYSDSEYSNNGSRPASRTVDGSGMDYKKGDYKQWTHGTDAGTTMWMGKNQNVLPSYYVAEFESASTVSSVKFYNFNMNNGRSYVTRGLQQVNVYVSTDASAFSKSTFKKDDFKDKTKWTLVTNNHEIAVASGEPDYTGDKNLLDLGEYGKGIRYFGLEIVSDHGGGYGGLSEVIFLADDNALSVSLGEVTDISKNGATISGKLSGEGGPVDVYLAYGQADGGSDSNDWEHVELVGSKSVGEDFEVTLDGLEAGKKYYSAFFFEDEKGDLVWSAKRGVFYTDPLTLTVTPIYGPMDDYGSREKRYTVTVTRSSTFASMELNCSLAFSGTAVANEDYVPLSSTTLKLEKDKTSVSASFRTKANPSAEEDRTLTITLDGGAFGVYEPKSISFTILSDKSVVAKTTTWTGGGDGTSWVDVANWDNGVPGFKDTAVFGSAVSAGSAITISNSCQAACIRVETAAAFSFAADAAEGEHTLGFGGFSRPAVDGTSEGYVDFNVPISIWATDGEKCPWLVDGARGVRLYADQRRANDTVKLYKTGSGAIEFRYANVSMALGLCVREGSAATYANKGNSLKGEVTIGGGEVPARLDCGEKSLSGVKPIVNTNGTFSCGTMTSGMMSEISVTEGGYANISRAYIYKVYLTGGKLVGGTFDAGGYGQTLTSYASDITAIFGNSFQLAGNYDGTVAVQDGSQPVDLYITGGFWSKSDAATKLTRTGAGTVLSTGNMSNLYHPLFLNGGTWYVNNTSNCGLGRGKTAVNKGATLAGIGFLGGTVYGSVVSATGDSTAFATVAPGSIVTNTGAHVCGTLTVGSADKTNDVTFAAYSKLRITVGEKRANDCLAVYGTLKLGGANSVLELATEDLAKVKSGEYVIATASEGVSGTFGSVSAPEGTKWSVVYREKDVVLSVPGPGLIMIVR